MSPIAPPALVLTDGGSGFARACKNIWPTTRRVSVRLCTGTDLQVCGEPVGVGHG